MKKKKRKSITEKEIITFNSIEYTTEELIELGKKLNVLKLARPLYNEIDKDNKNDEWMGNNKKVIIIIYSLLFCYINK